MRRLLQIFLFVLVLGFVVSGCRQSKAERGLVAIDTLIARGSYDSALARLRAVDTAALSADERAYHGLLMTHAAYKAYDSAYLDTTWIARARTAYANGGPYDRHIRTLLYSGCVAEDLGDPLQAMRWYKRTELETREDDHYHRGLALMNMGHEYQVLNIHTDSAISKYSMALREYQAHESDSSFTLWCLFNLGQLYRLVDYDSSMCYLKQSLSVAQRTGDVTTVYLVHEALAGLYDLMNDYKNSKHHALKVINEGMSPELYTCYSYAAMAYLHEGKADSAKLMLASCPSLPLIRDSVLHCRATADLENFLGHHTIYAALSDSASELSGKRLMRNAQTDVISQEIAMQKEHLTQKKNRHYYIMAFIGLMMLILLATFAYYFRNKFTLTSQLLHQERTAKNELGLALEQLNKKLEEIKTNLSHPKPIDEKQSIFQSNINSILMATTFIGKHKKSIFSLDEVKDYDINLGDKEWEEIERYLAVAYPNAMKTVKNVQPPLTKNELRIISLECMEIPNAVQAKLLGYTPRSCITARQRVTEKLSASGMTIKQTIEQFELQEMLSNSI